VTDVPKAAVTAGDGAFVSEFVETHCRITKDSFGGPVGDLLSLRPWQREMFGRLLARQPGSLQRRHRFGLVGVPRKNGKSAMIAGLALYGLLMEDAGAEVYSVAGDRDQARLVFGTAKRMVEMDAELSAVTKLYRDAIEDPASGSVYRAVSAEAPLKEGLSPTLTVVDEVHVINEDLWNVFALAMGARPEPLLVGITTAGARYDSRGRETICYRLWQYGTQLATGHESDPSFYFEWWGAPEELDYRLPSTWALANPGYGDILDPADLAAAVGPTMEPEYRTKRLNQWVDHSTAAFPVGAWKACDAPSRVVSSSEPIVLGFDGSWTGDSTAIVGCTVADRHLFVVDAWEKPPNANGWRVDAATVDTRVRAFCRDHNVVELACDPYEWRGQIQAWERDLKADVTQWPSASLARSIPAWKEFYAAVLEHRLTHDGDPRLQRHADHAGLKIDRHGARLDKEHAGAKIDLLMASMIAWDRAEARASAPVRQPARFTSF
jgi:phage terminase large subunit-like protein